MTGTIVLPTAGPLTAAAFSGNINTALAALSNMFQSGTAPTTTSTGLASLAGLWWHDTTNKQIKVRNQADTAWITIGTLDETNNLFIPTLNVSQSTYTSTGANTVTKPAWATWAIVELWGAGGSGSRQSNSANPDGGGGGGYIKFLIRTSALNATETLTVGAGGASRTGSNQAGANGGNTTFTIGGSTGATAGGGTGGGTGGAAAGAGGLAFGGTTLNANAIILNYENGATGAGALSPTNATAVVQGGGGGAAGSGTASTPAWLGSGAGGATGTAGAQPGGGGGASTTTSGAGGNGQGRVTFF